jgi:hypothetical protein
MSPDRRYSSEGLTASIVPKVGFAATKAVAISASLPISGQTYAELNWIRTLRIPRWHPQKPETCDHRPARLKLHQKHYFDEGVNVSDTHQAEGTVAPQDIKTSGPGVSPTEVVNQMH